MRAYLTYFIACACLARGSTIHPLYNNSSAAAKVAANASSATHSSVGINSTYLEMQLWMEPDCTGGSNTYKNITSSYSTSAINYSRKPYLSFKINCPLRGREQLDLSTNVGGGPLNNSTNWCEVFLHSYWPWTSPDSETAAPVASAAPVVPDVDVPANNSSDTTAGSSETAAGSSCPDQDGTWNCISGTTFQRCASGEWSVVQSVAEGTTCEAGISQNIKFVNVAKPRRAVRFLNEHIRRHQAYYS